MAVFNPSSTALRRAKSNGYVNLLPLAPSGRAEQEEDTRERGGALHSPSQVHAARGPAVLLQMLYCVPGRRGRAGNRGDPLPHRLLLPGTPLISADHLGVNSFEPVWVPTGLILHGPERQKISLETLIFSHFS